MSKTYPLSSASSAPASFDARPEDGAVSLEELNRRKQSPVARLLATPPTWLKNQTTIYRRNPTERMLNPLCAAIAHEIGANPDDIRPEVERALGKPA